ncbi:MAG: C25 family cysteine peptidase [Thermoguttaceae bacterium]
MNRNKFLAVLFIFLLTAILQDFSFSEDAISTVNSESKPLLVIVTPKQFLSELEPFVEHKRKELTVEIAELDTVLTENSGVDDPEKLKRFLYDAWKNRQAHYVLLVGDADVMPVRYMVLDRITPEAYDYSFYPSDLYYADVAKEDGSFDDWNARKDDFHALYYGEVRGEKNKNDPMNFDQIHYKPELAFGRWPVSTPEGVRTVATKTIEFENRIASQTTSPFRAAFVCNSGWIDTRSEMDREAKALPESWTIEKRYFSDARRESDTPPPNYDEIMNLLNSGVDLMLHAGHGLGDQWEQSLHLRDYSKIQNASYLPVMISIGCETARFTTLPPYEPYIDVNGVEHKGTYAGEVFDAPPPPSKSYSAGKYNLESLGKKIVTGGPNGAVAYIGCNTGGQPCALTLMDGFTESWGQSPSARLGDCWKEAVSNYYDKQNLDSLKPDAGWYPASIFFQSMKYMVYGDPSLRLPH